MKLRSNRTIQGPTVDGVTGERSSTKSTNLPMELTAPNGPMMEMSIQDYVLDSPSEDIKHISDRLSGGSISMKPEPTDLTLNHPTVDISIQDYAIDSDSEDIKRLTGGSSSAKPDPTDLALNHSMIDISIQDYALDSDPEDIKRVTGESSSTKLTNLPVGMTAPNDPMIDVGTQDYVPDSASGDSRLPEILISYSIGVPFHLDLFMFLNCANHLGENDSLFDLNELPNGLLNKFLMNLDYDSDDDTAPRKRSKSGNITVEKPTDYADFTNGMELDPSLYSVDEPEYVDVPRRGARKKRRNQRRKGKPVLMWEVWEEENEKWVEDHMKEDANLDQINQASNETVEEPKDLILPLLRYQKEWLAWSMKQEESVAKGGILADEMGMGKTLQAISLVLAKRELQRETCEVNESSMLTPSTEVPLIRCTLVICPVVAVTQWVDEITRFTAKGSVKVLVYHGVKRGKSVQQFSGFDFVITTYSTVEADYRRYVMPPKKKCQWCGKAYTERRMAHHEKYFCGPDAVRTEKQSKQDRKHKKPYVTKKKDKLDVSLTDSEDDKHTGSSRKPYKKRKVPSKGKGEPPVEFPETDMINENKGRSILHSVKWERIILDEAHYVKDKRSNTARAILALESSYKWALSGTPLQNRVGELYSLIRFLQIVPYSFYMCKDCDCRVLDYSVGSDCPNCPHKCVRHFCWWNRYVATPIQESGGSEAGRGAMLLLKHKVLKTILLRRTKKDRASDLALPPRIITLRRDNLDIKEEDYYTSLYNDSQAQFNTYVQRGTVLNNYAHIFDLLTRLRQAVDHPYLVVYSSKNASNASNDENPVDIDQNEQACGICHETVEDPVVTSCAHAFCKACLIDYSSSFGQVACPTCSKPLTVDFSSSSNNGDRNAAGTIKGFRRSSIINRIQLNDFQTSTKIDALREEIRFMIERDGSAKGIIFSQFTQFLDLISYSLQKSGITCVQLVGNMTLAARDAAIKRFNEDPDCRIFLMSLKAGGVALNLTVASHVFLMDPWWNPAVERQAQDRIHRIGQFKPIRIVRFVIANTVEERILQLQEKKQLVFEGTVGGSSDALGKLTEADLRFLFIT